MLRLMAVGMAIPTIFAAWAGTQLPPAQAAPAQPPAGEQVTVVGCLARQTPDGAAPTPEQPRSESTPFVLTRARLVDPASKTAVPGTSPSTNDTGTIAGAIARAPSQANVRDRSFTLTGGDAAMLAKQVGERVEVVGIMSRVAAGESASPQSAHTVTDPRERRQGVPADSAHPSAPAERLTVVTFRSIGGACL
jgi:hypothetical protein